MESKIHEYVRAIAIDNILRIDIGLEFDEITRSHAINKPNLEFYYGDSWLGMHCFQRNEEKNIREKHMRFTYTNIAARNWRLLSDFYIKVFQLQDKAT